MCQLVSRVFLLVEKVTFWIRTCLHHLIDLIVFLEQLSTICRTKVGMSYKAILQHDRWGHAHTVIGADLHTEISKAGMSILGDAKSCYLKNSSVNSVIIYIYMNILKMNVWIFLH